MKNNKQTVILADMLRCEPPQPLWKNPRKGCWQIVSFETEEGIKGNMAYASPEDEAGEIRLPLKVSGVYKIFLGINYTRTPGSDTFHHRQWPLYGQLEAKLTNDNGYSRFALEIGWSSDNIQKVGRDSQVYKSIQEVYWKTADLTNQAVTFRPMQWPYNTRYLGKTANISYVKLVPDDGEALDAGQKLQPRPETRRIALHWCTGILTGHAFGTPDYHPADPDWYAHEIQPYLNNDVGIFIFEAIRGNLCAFRTKIGDVGGKDNLWKEEWIDSLAAFEELAHANGMKIFSGMRMMGPGYPMVPNPIGWGNFYWKNRQWAKLDREGVPTTNLSIAFPEVRNHWISLLRETLNYGIDGVQIYLHRCQPFILYEKPVVQSFNEKYGEDPRKISSKDPRWLEHSAEYVTTFLREIRALVNEKPGRELGVTFYGTGFKYETDKIYDPLKYNCDVLTWIKEGLVDYLMPTTSVEPGFIEQWREAGGEKLHIWPDMMPRNQPGEDFVRLAKDYYQRGANGLSLWDGDRRPGHASEWAVLRQLGHREELDSLLKAAPHYHRKINLKYLNGFSVHHSFHDG